MSGRPAVVVRADASHAIGFGHVARLCAIIEELSVAGAEPIVMFGGDDAVAAWTCGHGIAAPVRPPSQPWSCAELVSAALSPRVRAVVIDGPPLAGALIPALVERGIRTVAVDDRGDCDLAVDAVVNHNFHAPSLAASYPGARLRLLGRDYLMLRHAVRRHARGACRATARSRLRVVVTFGGSDPVGATARTLRLLPADRPLDLAVIAGPGFRDDAALVHAAIAAATTGHMVEIMRDPEDLDRVFVGADAAICSAGGTLGELAYLGCPALAFAIVPDQVAGARAQREAGLVAGGRAWAELDDEVLRGELGAFLADDRGRREQRDRALATADGAGARRIVAAALGQARS